MVNYAADQAELTALNMVTADPLRTPTFVAFSPGDDFVNSIPAAAVFNSSASTKLSDPTSNAYNGCSAISGDPSSCSESTYTYVHGDFAPETNDTWAGLVGPDVQNLGRTTWFGPITWTFSQRVLDLVGLHESVHSGRPGHHADNRPAVTLPTLRTPRRCRAPDAQTLGLDLKQLYAPVYQNPDGALNGFGPATLAADTAALGSGSSSSDTLYTTVEGDISHITAERNVVVSDIQAQLLAAELNNTSTNGATDEADTVCILLYANTLKAYAQSGGTSPAPTDCGIATGPPAVRLQKPPCPPCSS